MGTSIALELLPAGSLREGRAWVRWEPAMARGRLTFTLRSMRELAWIPDLVIHYVGKTGYIPQH